MDLPERLRFDEAEEEDVDDGTGVKDGFPARSMYGMLAAAQSRPNFKKQFTQQESASDSEGEDDKHKRRSVDQRRPSKEISRDADKGRKPSEEGRTSPRPEESSKRHKARLSVNRLARSVLSKHELKPTTKQTEEQEQDAMTSSQILPPRVQETTSEARATFVRPDATVLDRKLKAMAQAELDASTSTLTSRKSREEGKAFGEVESDKTNHSLAHVIADIFQFAEPEEVTSEFQCWYLQNVLLQGFMYITTKHVCFYAYLQKKTTKTVKSGHLGKLGKHSYRYRRYWFVLRGDSFSYYNSSAEPYFPNNVVDLRYAISAELAAVPGKEETASDFTITTPSRVYQYRADMVSSAKDWVKQLQKVIFRTHNDGDSVKISLPIDSIMDVERTGVVDFAETIKLRVVDNEETFAIDEYFFTFFHHGEDAVKALIALAAGNGAKKLRIEGAISPLSKHRSPAGRKMSSAEQSPRLSTIKSTLLPASAAEHSVSRSSGERRRLERRASSDHGVDVSDRGRTSASAQGRDSRNASKSPMSPSIHASSESFVTSSEPPDSSVDGDAMDADMSASQMLSDDHVFRGPTLRTSQARRTAAGQPAGRPRQVSIASSRDSSGERDGIARVQAPSWPATYRSMGNQRPTPQRTESGDSARTAEPDDRPRPEPSGPKLIRGISTPLQHAMNVAGAVRAGSKRVGSYLSSSPKTYITNWTEAMAGGKRHYTDIEGLAHDEGVREPERHLDYAEHERRFQEHFGLPPTEKLVSVFYCWLHKTVPLWGKIYMGTRRLCFRSLYYGTSTKLIIPYKDILNVQKQRGFRWGYPGMVLVIRGYEELFFDFQDTGLRDDCVVSTLRTVEVVEAAAESMILTEVEQQDASEAAAENALLRAARQTGHDDEEGISLPEEVDALPVIFDDPSASVLEFRPKKSLNITCLTIGSRGDVQPYIALCKGLLAEGHKPTIATHAEFRGWVEKHGIAFKEVDGDPAELMRICVENGMFTPSFFLEANSKFRSWLDELLVSSWAACQGADLIIESPSAMSGIHIAEALEVPYFRAFTMPWTRTRAYPHAFAVPSQKRGGGYNYMTYIFFDNMFFAAIAGQINRWRGKTLKLGPTSLDRLQQNKVPFLYNFSPSVVPQPLDFSDWIKVTGYWFLDEGEDYVPPAELAAFIKKARDDEQKLVYIGFGSVTVSDSRQLMQQIVDAVVKADVRCILSKGWSDRFETAVAASQPALVLPSCMYEIRAAPHDWLFKQVDAVVHHGGAGTTGASLRCGVPTIIKPFFGDQFFFATRVEDLGVGQHLKKVTGNQLGRALWYATHDERMRSKARLLGEAIRSEKGVDTAIKAIYRDMEYAKSLIKKKKQQQQVHGATTSTSSDGANASIDLSEDTEENWTFVEMEGEAAAAAAAAAAETEAFGALAAELGGGGGAESCLPGSSSKALHGQRSHSSSFCSSSSSSSSSAAATASGQHSRAGGVAVRGGRS